MEYNNGDYLTIYNNHYTIIKLVGGPHISISTKYYCNSNSTVERCVADILNSNVRSSSPSEIMHLNQCIKEKKFVELKSDYYELI